MQVKPFLLMLLFLLFEIHFDAKKLMYYTRSKPKRVSVTRLLKKN